MLTWTFSLRTASNNSFSWSPPFLFRFLPHNLRCFLRKSSCFTIAYRGIKWTQLEIGSTAWTVRSVNNKRMWRNYSISSSKTLDQATQSWTNTKIPPNESKFYRHNRHNFFKEENNCNVPDFSIYLASCRVKTRAKIAQHMRFSPRNSKTLRQPQFFSHSTKTSLFNCIVCKGLWENATSKPRKELGRDLV